VIEIKKSIINLWSKLGKPFRNQLTSFHYNFSAGTEFKHIKRVMCYSKKHIFNIVDGGSANGGTIIAWKKFFPESFVYAFEPIENDEIKRVEESFSKVKVSFLALGSKEETKKLNVNKYSDTSSFYNNISSERNYQREKAIDVKVTTLDKWCNKNYVNVDILKLDLQGYELEALKGAKEQLENNIEYILLEASFREFYVNQPLFCAIEEFLKKYNFILYNMYKGYEGKIGFVNCLFVKDYERN